MADFEDDDDPVGAFVDMIDGIRSGQVVCVEVAVALPDGAPITNDGRSLLSDSRVREALHAGRWTALCSIWLRQSAAPSRRGMPDDSRVERISK